MKLVPICVGILLLALAAGSASAALIPTLQSNSKTPTAVYLYWDVGAGVAPPVAPRGPHVGALDLSACQEVVALDPQLANNSTAANGSALWGNGTSEIVDMFWSVCRLPEFSALIQAWGASNFSLGFM